MFNKHNIKDFLIITGGTGIVAIAVYFFMLPSHVSVGSATALAMVLSNFIPLRVSVITFIMNVVLLILGFLLIGPEFGAKTVYSTLLLPVMLGILEIVFPNFQSLTLDPMLDVICYILVVGIGLAILFSRNAASGGLDIVAKIMNKFLRMDLGQAMSISGIVVALSSALVYDKKISAAWWLTILSSASTSSAVSASSPRSMMRFFHSFSTVSTAAPQFTTALAPTTTPSARKLSPSWTSRSTAI